MGLPQTFCAVNSVLDVALLAEPGAEVWFWTEGDPSPPLPVAGVSGCRTSGSVCLLAQHPAAYSFELVAELSYEHPEEPVWLRVPGEDELVAYAVRHAEVVGDMVFLIGTPVRQAHG